MLVKVRSKRTDKVFSNDMSENNKNTILSIHFCTSYTQVCVQEQIEDEDGNIKYPSYDLILPPVGKDIKQSELTTAVDLSATKGDEKGEWVE